MRTIGDLLTRDLSRKIEEIIQVCAGNLIMSSFFRESG